jgi:membrane dipeptidase
MRDDTGLRHRSKQVRAFAYGVLIALVLATGYFVFDNSRVADHSYPFFPNSVWVLNFTHVGKDWRDDELAGIWAANLMESLTHRLAGSYDDLRVSARIADWYPTTHEEVMLSDHYDHIAYLVEGHMQVVDDQIHVSVKLFDVKGERYLWSNEYGMKRNEYLWSEGYRDIHAEFIDDESPLDSQIARDIHASVSQASNAVAVDSVTEQSIHQGYSDTAPQYEVDGRVISNNDIEAILWNPRGKTREQIVMRLKFLESVYELERTGPQLQRAAEARAKYKNSILINSVIPLAPSAHADDVLYANGLKHNRDAGFTLVSTSIYGFPGDGDSAISERIDRARAIISELDMVVANDSDDIRQAKKDGKMAVFFNAQGADFIIEDMTVLEELKSDGLQVGNFDAAEYSTKLIVPSHSNPLALLTNNRNMTDEVLKAVGDSEGVVCSVGAGLFLTAEGDASPVEYAKRVEYTANLIGRDKTCFGTDYVLNGYVYFMSAVFNVDIYPPEAGFGAPISKVLAVNVWDVAAILEDEYGWSEEDVRGFLGENLMRVYEANWK